MELLTGSNAYHLTHSICTAQDIVSRPEKPHSGRKEKGVWERIERRQKAILFEYRMDIETQYNVRAT